MTDVRPSDREAGEPRLSPEFYRRLETYFGGASAAAPDDSRSRAWWRDHVGERSAAIRAELTALLGPDWSFRGRQVLDFGCGTGSSTAVVAERATSVLAVEPEPVSMAVAEQRIEDLGLTDRVTFEPIPYLSDRSDRYLAPDGCIDVTLLCGVLEHMHAGERQVLAREIHRVTRVGGDLVVLDTPNRLFPFDAHTTQLRWVGVLPVAIAHAYAKWCGRMPRAQTRREFERLGATGVSRWQLARWFPPRRWQVVADKSRDQVLREYATLGRGFAALARVLLTLGGFGGVSPAHWTASHSFVLRKMC